MRVTLAPCSAVPPWFLTVTWIDPIGIVTVTVLSFFFAGNTFHGVFAAPPSIAPTFLQLDIKAALSGGILNVVLVFFLVELFDATGKLTNDGTRKFLQGFMQAFEAWITANTKS